jgi:hypothetical protein
VLCIIIAIICSERDNFFDAVMDAITLEWLFEILSDIISNMED